MKRLRKVSLTVAAIALCAIDASPSFSDDTTLELDDATLARMLAQANADCHNWRLPANEVMAACQQAKDIYELKIAQEKLKQDRIRSGVLEQLFGPDGKGRR